MLNISCYEILIDDPIACSNTSTMKLLLLYMSGRLHLCGYQFDLLNIVSNVAVMASMPGYRSKSACVILGEGALTVDFVLDPETRATHEGSRVVEDSGCYFDSKTSLQVVDFLPAWQLEISVLLFLMLGFLCFLMQRRARPNHLSQKQMPLPRRAVV